MAGGLFRFWEPMASTGAQLVTKVKRMAQLEYADGDGPITDAEILDYINEEYAELWDLLVQKHEDFFTKKATVTQASGLLPLPADGVMRIRKLLWNGSSPEPTNLRMVTLEEYDRYTATQDDPVGYMLLDQSLYPVPAPANGATYTLYYVPDFTPLASTTSTIHVALVARWEDYIVLGAAIRCLEKEDRDATHLAMKKAAKQMMIKQSATDRAGVDRVKEVRRYDDDDLDRWSTC